MCDCFAEDETGNPRASRDYLSYVSHWQSFACVKRQRLHLGHRCCCLQLPKHPTPLPPTELPASVCAIVLLRTRPAILVRVEITSPMSPTGSHLHVSGVSDCILVTGAAVCNYLSTPPHSLRLSSLQVYVRLFC